MKDGMITAILVISVLLLIVAIPVSCGVGIDAFNCHSITRNTGKPTKYSPISGCYVQVGGEWVPLDAWRVVK